MSEAFYKKKINTTEVSKFILANCLIKKNRAILIHSPFKPAMYHIAVEEFCNNKVWWNRRMRWPRRWDIPYILNITIAFFVRSVWQTLFCCTDDTRKEISSDRIDIRLNYTMKAYTQINKKMSPNFVFCIFRAHNIIMFDLKINIFSI